MVIGTTIEIPEGKISAIIEVDRARFSLMNPIAPDEFNSDITLYVQKIPLIGELPEDKKPLRIGGNVVLEMGREYKLTGFYDNFNSTGFSEFKNIDPFVAGIYTGNSRTLKITIKGGSSKDYVSLSPL